MAIIKIGPLLAGIRGTIGGVTYSENGSGPYAKVWAPPTQPMTPNQTIERGYMSRIPNLWRDLTPVQKAAWDTFAALAAQELFNSLGESYYASGYGWFSKCNVRLLRTARATIKPVPTQARPAAATIDDFRVCIAGTEFDLCVCGVASSSTESVGHGPALAFDDILTAAKTWWALVPATTGWLQYDFCDPHNIKRYRIYSHPGDPTVNPSEWTFEVDSGGWQVIHTVTGETGWALGEWQDFYCPNPYTETDYRINITANDGHANILGVTEMEMYAADLDASVVCFPEDDFANAPVYDLILHISLGGSTGKQVQYPGFYEITASQSAGRHYHLFQDELESVFGTIAENRSWFCRLYRQTQEGIRSTAATERTETIET